MEKSINEAAKQFIRVGDDYYKITYRPDKNKTLHRQLVKRSKTTITDDYGKKIIDKISKYEGFVMIPSHFDYEQVIHDYYNTYHELPHKPLKGKISTIIGYLTHIFGRDYLDFILDYFQLLYLRPTQKLPVILLESEAKNTGKSTFGDLVRAIFEFNTISLGNGDLSSDFNSVWVEKLVIIVDETALEADGIMQMIKNLSTKNGAVLSNAKGKDKEEKEFIGKFVFISNKEGKALPIEKGDDRFAVFKVPTFEENNIERDPDIMSKLKKEIPAFLYYLKNRTLHHEHIDRMYFEKSVYFTDQLQVYFEGSNTVTAKAIIQMVKDTLEAFPEENKLCFSESQIRFEIQNYLKFTDKQKIKDSLERELGKKVQKKNRYTYFSLHSSELSESYYPDHNNSNRVHYIFERHEYFNDSLNSTIDPFAKVEQMAVF
jgi:hypothetical protein